jgi:hypothetical protein
VCQRWVSQSDFDDPRGLSTPPTSSGLRIRQRRLTPAEIAQMVSRHLSLITGGGALKAVLAAYPAPPSTHQVTGPRRRCGGSGFDARCGPVRRRLRVVAVWSHEAWLCVCRGR